VYSKAALFCTVRCSYSCAWIWFEACYKRNF